MLKILRMLGLESESVYLANQHRLTDLIAAIQAMGSYRYSSRTVDKWEQILKKPKSSESWVTIFREHPEFFRASWRDKGEHQLVLRRAQDKVYDTNTGALITVAQYFALSEPQRSIYSRKPLSNEQIISLIEIAVKLQNQAVARRQELRWWIPVLTGLLGVAAGAIVKS